MTNEIKLTVTIGDDTEYTFSSNEFGRPTDDRSFNDINWVNSTDAEALYDTLRKEGLSHTRALYITECEFMQVMGIKSEPEVVLSNQQAQSMLKFFHSQIISEIDEDVFEDVASVYKMVKDATKS